MDSSEKTSKRAVMVWDHPSSNGAEWNPLFIQENANILSEEVNWLVEILEQRIEEEDQLIEDQEDPVLFEDFEAPVIQDSNTSYARLVKRLQLNAEERLMLICSLVPHFSPETLTDRLGDKDQALKVRFPAAGGYINRIFRSYCPTFQTTLWLLTGNSHSKAVYYSLVLSQSQLIKERIITLSSIDHNAVEDNERNKALMIATEYVNYLVSGDMPRPDFGRAFPATMVETNHEWSDLILNDSTSIKVKEVCNWMEYGEALIEIGEGKINPSYPCLFFGPPGTGKSMTAKLIGKQFDKHVFRIDLSMIVSKYIGETEKNLARLFDSAEGKDWVLFFDEAESLFSKRTDVSSSNDKWANLEVSYLLTRMEEYRGLTILATNLRENLDQAMIRRFQAMIEFGRPGREERKLLWKGAIPQAFQYAPEVSFDKLANYNLTGANISNIIKTACLAAMAEQGRELNSDLLSKAILKELAKEDRTP